MAERSLIVKKFNESEVITVLVASSDCISERFNITSANWVLPLTLHEYPVRAIQLLGRAKRIGQTHNVSCATNLL